VQQGEVCSHRRHDVLEKSSFDCGHNLDYLAFSPHLSENQCKQYTNIGQNNCKTVVKWYNKCRDVCGKWIWANKPKLGGYGNIVEMDESHFAGVPKYGKGRRIGEDPWKQWNKWVFGLTQRVSLDCVLRAKAVTLV
jgi:hypothetical protein